MSMIICQGEKGERESEMNEKGCAGAENLHPDCRGDNHPGLIYGSE